MRLSPDPLLQTHAGAASCLGDEDLECTRLRHCPAVYAG
jgi:hypothetical protein